MKELPIGVIDSGIGGASILKEIIKVLPNERYIYLVDNRNMPYGNKTKRKILKRVYENVKFLTEKYHIKLLVIACNTASSVCANYLRKKFSFPIICVEPPIKPAVESNCKKILILATEQTLKSNKTIKNSIKNVNFSNKNLKKEDKIIIKKLAVKNLAKDIDKNVNNLNNLQKKLNENLKNYVDFESIVIGCTHYNFIKNQIQKSLPNTRIISCEKAVANRTKFVLEREKIELNKKSNLKNLIILTKPNIKIRKFLENYLN